MTLLVALPFKVLQPPKSTADYNRENRTKHVNSARVLHIGPVGWINQNLYFLRLIPILTQYTKLPSWFQLLNDFQLETKYLKKLSLKLIIKGSLQKALIETNKYK